MNLHEQWRLLLVNAALTAVISVSVALLTVRWQAESAPDHLLTITPVKSDAAAIRESVFVPSGGSVFEDIFGTGGVYVEATIPPESVGLYTYTVIVRNAGDFPETNVKIELSYKPAGASLPLIDQEVAGSSSPLLKTLTTASENPNDPESVTYTVPRLNPNEWLSFSFTWAAPVEISIVARSEHVTTDEQV